MEFEINAFVFLNEDENGKKQRIDLGNIKFEAKNQAAANKAAYDLAVPLIPEALKGQAQGVGYEWIKGGEKKAPEVPKAVITPPSKLSSPILGSTLPYGLKEIPNDDAAR